MSEERHVTEVRLRNDIQPPYGHWRVSCKYSDGSEWTTGALIHFSVLDPVAIAQEIANQFGVCLIDYRREQDGRMLKGTGRYKWVPASQRKEGQKTNLTQD